MISPALYLLIHTHSWTGTSPLMTAKPATTSMDRLVVPFYFKKLWQQMKGFSPTPFHSWFRNRQTTGLARQMPSATWFHKGSIVGTLPGPLICILSEEACMLDGTLEVVKTEYGLKSVYDLALSRQSLKCPLKIFSLHKT